MASRKLFINYRRDDSRADAGRLYDRLHARYPGRVFRDVGSLEPGVEWHEAIDKVLGSSDACIVVVGRNWLTVVDAAGKRRIDDPRDTCRKEVATAIQNGMRIFPVLVGGAKMPAEEDLPEDLRPLARRNALEISEQDWDEDVDKLGKAIERALGWRAKEPSRGMTPIALAIAAVVIAIVGGAAYLQTHKSPTPPETKEAGPTPTPSGGKSDPVAPPPEITRAQPVKAGHDPIGSWRAVTSQGANAIVQRVELYPDSSVRVVLENNLLTGIARWKAEPGGGIAITDGASFVSMGVRFSCNLQADGDSGFQGRCSDTTQAGWDVTFSSPRRLVPPPDGLPRIDVSSGTMAEKAAFVQALSIEPCTCGCHLTMHNCLLKDLTCPQSPTVAQNQWAAFLRVTRA